MHFDAYQRRKHIGPNIICVQNCEMRRVNGDSSFENTSVCLFNALDMYKNDFHSLCKSVVLNTL